MLAPANALPSLVAFGHQFNNGLFIVVAIIIIILTCILILATFGTIIYHIFEKPINKLYIKLLLNRYNKKLRRQSRMP
jgi:peptidoglycan/LPS O-acetylase OafA/YrhL